MSRSTRTRADLIKRYDRLRSRPMSPTVAGLRQRWKRETGILREIVAAQPPLTHIELLEVELMYRVSMLGCIGPVLVQESDPRARLIIDDIAAEIADFAVQIDRSRRHGKHAGKHVLRSNTRAVDALYKLDDERSAAGKKPLSGQAASDELKKRGFTTHDQATIWRWRRSR